MRRTTTLALACAAALAVAGCGGGGVKVDGKVVNGGSPYALGEGEGININLTPEGGGPAVGGQVEKDGSFKIAGLEGAGMAPGKYKVSVTHYPPSGGKAAKGPPMPVTKNLGESWDVSASNHTFTLDMAKVK
ncbi:MAG: hypothetical protein U0804_05125 [Gemmataceae bacterium]